MTKKLNIGDVVRLKSGGPNMTVTITHDNPHPTYSGKNVDKDHVNCTWYNKDTSKYEEAAFRIVALDLIDMDA